MTQARRKAESANIILVNHHLFFSDLSLRSTTRGARVLPDYDAVIFDESHLLEEIMTEHFSLRVSWSQFATLSADLQTAAGRQGAVDTGEIPFVAKELETSANGLFTALTTRIAQIGTVDSNRSELPSQLFADTTIESRWFALDGVMERFGQRAIAVAQAPDQPDEIREELIAIGRRVDRKRNDLAAIAETNLQRGGHTDHVPWCEMVGGKIALRASPTDVSTLLLPALSAMTPTAVFTSATLTVEDRFDYIRDRLGLDKHNADDLVLQSPFCYRDQALLYLPRDLPLPSEATFDKASCERVEELLELTQGRAFVLFTSYRALHAAANRLRKRVPYPVFVQGERPHQELVNRFRDQPGVPLRYQRILAGD